MTKIVSSRELIRALEADGWVLDHVSGSHQIFRHASKRGPVMVPHPRKSLARAVLKKAGLLS